MNPAEVKRVLEIVEDALELTGVELDEYLDRVCGSDSPLRREVLDYLQYDSSLSIFHGVSEEQSSTVWSARNSSFRYELQEETPELSLPMALELMKATMSRPTLTETDAIRLTEYHLHRNRVARNSHRKSWLRKHKRVKPKPLL